MSPEQVSSVIEDLQNERSAALTSYRRLIRLPDLSPADRKALVEAMRVLNKTPDQLRADINALGRITWLQTQIRDTLSPENTQRQEAATDALEDHRIETHTILEDRKREEQQLYAALSAINEKMVAANHQWKHELYALQQAHRDIFGDEEGGN